MQAVGNESQMGKQKLQRERRAVDREARPPPDNVESLPKVQPNAPQNEAKLLRPEAKLHHHRAVDAVDRDVIPVPEGYQTDHARARPVDVGRGHVQIDSQGRDPVLPEVANQAQYLDQA